MSSCRKASGLRTPMAGPARSSISTNSTPVEGAAMTNIRLTAFKWVPSVVQGLVRDLPVRWALEEAGLDYEENLLAVGEHKSAAHRAVQPFGQVPVYEEDGLTLFESGAIVMHLGQRCPVL